MKACNIKPDSNRPGIKGDTELAYNCVDSLKKVKIAPGEQAKIMLIVPPYTRLQKPLHVILDNIKSQIASTIYPIAEYESLVKTLNNAGIFNIEEQKRAGVPMGLLRVGTGASLGGYDVKILDAVYEGRNQEEKYFQTEEQSIMLKYGLSDEEIIKKISEYKPHVIGISTNYTHQRGNSLHMIDIIKSFDKDIIVVVGGTHASSQSENILKTSAVDYIVRKQSDISFVDLLDVLTDNPKKKLNIGEISGISYKESLDNHETIDTKFMQDIDKIGIPNLDLINLDIYDSEYHSAGKRKLKNGKILHGCTSIGCDSNCTFCAIPGIQGPRKCMSENKLDQYLQYIKSFGVTELLMEDDNLLSDPLWSLTVFQKLKKHKFAWVEEGGVSLYNLIALLENTTEQELHKAKISNKVLLAKKNGINAEMIIKEMAESGCYSVYLAVETPNKESLRTSKKSILNADYEKTKKVIELFKKYHIKVTCGLMFGFINALPNGEIYVESKEQIRQTFERAKKLKEIGADYINFFIMTLLPGSKNFVRLGNLVPQNTDEAYSHEFGNISAPNNEWSKDELTLLRVKGIIDTIGIGGYIKMMKSGTWPI